MRLSEGRRRQRWRRNIPHLVPLEGQVERLNELPHAPEHDVGRAGEPREDLGAAKAEREGGRVRWEARGGGGGERAGQDGAAEEEAKGIAQEPEAPAEVAQRGGASASQNAWRPGGRAGELSGSKDHWRKVGRGEREEPRHALGGASGAPRSGVWKVACGQGRGDRGAPSADPGAENDCEESDVEAEEEGQPPALGREHPQLDEEGACACGVRRRSRGRSEEGAT